jgi:hypothetical protein
MAKEGVISVKAVSYLFGLPPHGVSRAFGMRCKPEEVAIEPQAAWLADISTVAANI